MNHKEVAAEFMRDLEILKATTVRRLFSEYDRERKKLNIHTGKDYPKIYPIKTKAKNNWLIFIRKSPSIEKYKGIDDICHCCVVYYYDKAGLVALRHVQDKNMIEAFWGHAFNRYNERLDLHLSTVVDMIKTFFNNCGYIHYLIYPTLKGKCNFGICKDGFVLGEVQNEGTWLVNKTFVSKELAYDNQNKLKANMMVLLKEDAVLKLAAKNFDKTEYQKTRDTIEQLTRA